MRKSLFALFLWAIPLFLGTNMAYCGEMTQNQNYPWWDDFALMLKNANADTALKMNSSALLCGVRDDPCWGIYAQRMRPPLDQIEKLHAAGLKALCWLEVFGTTQFYITHLEKNTDDSWVKLKEDPETTMIFLNHWGWQHYDGSGEIRWVGVLDYFDDHDFARPYTRTHPRYGCGYVTYPNGDIATGYMGSDEDPRTHRVYDAACSKSVLGDVTWEYGFNAEVNKTDPDTGQLHGPITGLLEVNGKYSGSASGGKDSACPVWIDYLRASITHALDTGLDGAWVDNFSAWDSFGSQPIAKAFGEWSVATFRDYLKDNFSTEDLFNMGIEDTDLFDMRIYLLNKCRAWSGGNAEMGSVTPQDPFDRSGVDIRNPAWRRPDWIEDPVWRAYLIHKRQTGTRALDEYYRTIKEIAADHGKPDFLVAGNDIPVISLGWVRGNLDMVSTELSWDWGLASGARGIMPPPRGSYVPVYKLAREHAKSRFVNVWMYVSDEQRGKPNIADVLHYQGLANHTLPMATPGGDRDAGSYESNTAFFEFVQSIKSELGNRKPVEEIGLYYSSSSQLLSFAPGGFLDHNNQEHIFAHWGWGTALTWLQHQYRAVPEWKLTRENLDGLKIFIIPNSIVFPEGDVEVLKEWVESGGKLIVTGLSGMRAGEDENFGRLENSSLTAFMGEEISRQLGNGFVHYLAQPIGLDFYKADEDRPKMLERFRTIIDDGDDFIFSDVENIPTSAGLVAYVDERGGRFFVDVSNSDIDIQTDEITPSPPIRFSVTLPDFLRGGKVSTRVLCPDGNMNGKIVSSGKNKVTIELPSIRLYACVVLEKD